MREVICRDGEHVLMMVASIMSLSDPEIQTYLLCEASDSLGKIIMSRIN